VADPSAVEGICDSCGGRLEHRSDDARDVIAARFEEYRRLTQPTLNYYRALGKLHGVDAGRPIDNVTAEIAEAVDENAKPGRTAAR
jgi:adenylate kinase